MGRPRRPVKPAAAAQDTPDEGERLKNLYDIGAVRHKLDETVSKVVDGLGYREKMLHVNIKIVLGFLAIGIALYAQFGLGKFPDNWWQTLACVVAYVIVSVVLNIYSQWAEGDAFMITHPAPGQSHGLRVSSRMDRYSDMYTLKISTTNPKDSSQSTLCKSVTAYFHEDGYVAEETVRKDVEGLVNELVQKKAR